MLRVLHCIYDDPDNPWVGGGGALRAWEIYRRLGGRVEATIATGSYPGAVDQVREGVRYRRLGAQRPYAWSRLTYARAATRLLAAGEYDVGVFDFSVYTPIRLPASRRVGLVVHMLHGPTARGRWGAVGGGVLAAAERRAIRRARWISTTSHWMVRQLRQVAGADAVIVPVGSGVDGAFFRVRREEEPFLLCYGRMDMFQKGLDTLLHGFARIAAQHPRLELRVAGRGKDAEAVQRLAAELSLGDRVRVLLGVTPDQVRALFGGALLMLMPSRLEGLPMAPAEAMAAGVPVIASDVGALAEVVQAPEAGVLVPPDDPEALASAAVRLLEQPERRAALSRAARAAAQRFSWDRVADDHLAFLNLIAAGRGDPQTSDPQ